MTGGDLVVDLTTQEVVFDDDADDVVSAIVQQAWASVSVERNLVDAGLSPEEAGAAAGAAAWTAGAAAGTVTSAV